MDLSFTPEEIAFREKMRSFFTTQIPAAIREQVTKGEHVSKAQQVQAQQILNANGLAVPHWPQEWGGQDWSPVQLYIYQEELQQACVPFPLAFNASMVGPVIAQFGTEEQKRKFLPATANLDIWWCQGFSEPGAGSDLASLRTTAIKDGDHYIVNGQKTWTTLAQYADWIFCLARTDNTAKKQLGISFILIDMKTPGITVRPIQTIDGGLEVNEVWFDDVRVPLKNLVGEENRGWDYAKFLLGNERTGIARVGVSKARIRRIKQLAALERVGDRALMDEPHFREKVAAVEVPNPASSILKLKGSELQQATTELLMDVVGPYILPYDDHEEGSNEPPVGPDYAAEAAPTYFNWRKVSIYGGSNEIQRNIVAKAILGF